MSERVDAERAEIAFETRLERSKRIRRQLDDVVRLHVEGLTVSLIAQRLVMSRHRVYFLLRVVELIDALPEKVGPGRRPGHKYTLKVPPIDGATDAA